MENNATTSDAAEEKKKKSKNKLDAKTPSAIDPSARQETRAQEIEEERDSERGREREVTVLLSHLDPPLPLTTSPGSIQSLW